MKWSNVGCEDGFSYELRCECFLLSKSINIVVEHYYRIYYRVLTIGLCDQLPVVFWPFL